MSRWYLGANHGNEGVTADAKTVTVMVIKSIHPNFKTVTVTVILGKQILKKL